MESMPTILTKQSRHVETLVDRMHSTRKHHNYLVLEGVITPVRTYDAYLKHVYGINPQATRVVHLYDMNSTLQIART